MSQQNLTSFIKYQISKCIAILACMRQGSNYSECGKPGVPTDGSGSHKIRSKNIEAYDNNPKLCLFCNLKLSYDKKYNNYCSQTCSGKASNLNRGRKLNSGINSSKCLSCYKTFTYKGNEIHKYCSRICMMAFWWQISKQKLLNDGYDTSYAHKIAKRYLVEYYEGKCKICDLNKWNGTSMPLVLDHINGNSNDGNLSNLRVICNNCDALTDTYKSKNRGNGRAKRRQRYQEGKSY